MDEQKPIEVEIDAQVSLAREKALAVLVARALSQQMVAQWRDARSAHYSGKKGSITTKKRKAAARRKAAKKSKKRNRK